MLNHRTLHAALQGAAYAVPLLLCSLSARTPLSRDSFPVLEEMHDKQQDMLDHIIGGEKSRKQKTTQNKKDMQLQLQLFLRSGGCSDVLQNSSIIELSISIHVVWFVGNRYESATDLYLPDILGDTQHDAAPSNHNISSPLGRALWSAGTTTDLGRWPAYQAHQPGAFDVSAATGAQWVFSR